MRICDIRVLWDLNARVALRVVLRYRPNAHCLILKRAHRDLPACHRRMPLADKGVIPPWLGMDGSGASANLAGRNTYHNYPTAIYAIFRKVRWSAMKSHE